VNYGCDIGSRRLAVACPETGYLAKLRLPVRGPANPPVDLPLLAAWIAEHVPVDAKLYLEPPYVGRPNLNMQTAIKLGMVAGAVIAAHGPGESVLVAQSTWKKAVIGHGNADKDAIRVWLKSQHPAAAAACEDDQDLYDATCLGLYGQLHAEAELEERRALS
jgi:Holliday junction resolvasome RuvABC endonuclease subunit